MAFINHNETMSGDAHDANSRLHRFASTHWSMVRRASDDAKEDSSESKKALQTLCETYWFPLYSFVRNKGYDANTAADLTQGFFADLLAREDLKKVSPELGKFRSFLLASLKHFISNQWERENAQKRGGGQRIISINAASADSRYVNEPVSSETPDDHYQKQWALTILQQAQNELAKYYEDRQSSDQFERLKIFLAGKVADVKIADVASDLQMTEVAAKVAIHRMRQKFSEILRSQIANTVSSENEVDEEIRQMFEILRK